MERRDLRERGISVESVRGIYVNESWKGNERKEGGNEKQVQEGEQKAKAKEQAAELVGCCCC